MELYVGLALAKENPQAACPVGPYLQHLYLKHSPDPHHVNLEALSHTTDKLRALASSIAASGMPVQGSEPPHVQLPAGSADAGKAGVAALKLYNCLHALLTVQGVMESVLHEYDTELSDRPSASV